MSDTIATILLLGITVALFSAVFIFVNRFPHPPAQSTNQFQTSLAPLVDCTGTAHATGVAVKVTMLSGPAVAGTAKIYLRQTPASSANWQYTMTSGVPEPWGFVGAHNSSAVPWTAGQTWCTYLKNNLGTANLTVLVITGGLLLYQNTVPGGSTNGGPTAITRTWTSPPQPLVKGAFSVNASLTGNLTPPISVYVSLAGIPGLPSSLQKMSLSGSTASLNVGPGLTTTPGSYIAFINGSQGSGSRLQNFSATVSITIVSPSGCGSGIAVSVAASPNPATQRTFQSPIATITNSGAAVVALNTVNFYANFTNNNSLIWSSGPLGPIPSNVSIGGGVKISPATPWMPGPGIGASQVTLRAVASFCGLPARLASGVQVISLSAAPFSMTFSAAPQTLPVGSSTTFRILVGLTNAGPLNYSNITGWIRCTSVLATNCGATAFASPPAYTTPGTSVATFNNTAPFVLGPYSTVVVTFYYTASVSASITLTATVQLTNSAWSALSTPKLTLTAQVTFTE